MNSGVKIMGGILIGALAGTIAGVLMAPSNGKRTRKMLMSRSKKFNKELNRAVHASLEDLKKNYNKKIEEYASNGASSINSMKEKMKV